MSGHNGIREFLLFPAINREFLNLQNVLSSFANGHSLHFPGILSILMIAPILLLLFILKVCRMRRIV